MPLLSIIIPTYNAEACVRQALESVVHLTWQDWECLLVDGASKDHTLDIVREYEARDTRFRHISEPDEGVYDAFNKGWKQARGEWVYFLGSDDVLLSDGLASLFESARPHLAHTHVVSGTIYIDKVDGRRVVLPSGSWEGCHQAKITRRSALEAMHGFDLTYPISADLDLYIRMKVAGYHITNVESRPLAVFSTGGQSQALKNYPTICKEYCKIYAKDPAKTYPTCRATLQVAYMTLGYIYRFIRTSFLMKK